MNLPNVPWIDRSRWFVMVRTDEAPRGVRVDKAELPERVPWETYQPHATMPPAFTLLRCACGRLRLVYRRDAHVIVRCRGCQAQVAHNRRRARAALTIRCRRLYQRTLRTALRVERAAALSYPDKLVAVARVLGRKPADYAEAITIVQTWLNTGASFGRTAASRS